MNQEDNKSESAQSSAIIHCTYFKIHGTILLHRSFTYHSFYTSESLELHPELKLEFELRPLETLVNEKEKMIVTLHLRNFRVEVKASTTSKYDSDSNSFQNILTTTLHKNNESICVKEKTIYNNISTFHSITINDFDEGEEAVIELGAKDKEKVLNCKIGGLLLGKECPFPREVETLKKEFVEDAPLYKVPSFNNYNIDLLPTYKSPSTQDSQLYLCHDMMGGYLQDTNQHSPTHPNHTYRCLHLPQAQIFNYFSHHLVSIPPMHWRRVCHRSDTICLGTVIVERSDPHESLYLNEEFMTLLVYLCRKFRFDGYLINIEYKVEKTDRLLSLLKYCRQLLHEKVPNSKLIWYDSVVYPTGAVNYQNELNTSNSPFYSCSDGIFLNYWWNQQKLYHSLKYYEADKPIYVGNDCFGRGTFGGGQYNISQAINTIRQVDKQKLKPALFAMAYTYENNGKENRELWKSQELAMYRGLKTEHVKIGVNDWRYVNQHINGMKWERSEDWAVTSFQNCQRFWTKSLKNYHSPHSNTQLKIKFMTIVQGTGPKFNDPYIVHIRVQDQGLLYNESTTGMQIASEKEEQVCLEVSIQVELITPTMEVVVQCAGRDVEKWAGNYGSRFRGDVLVCSMYTKEADWGGIKTPVKKITSLPYQTFCNLGHGDHFYYQGIPHQSQYDYLSDQDYPATHLLNPPDACMIDYSQAYMGGTCMKINRNKIVLCRTNLAAENQPLHCYVVEKKAEIKEMIFESREGKKFVGEGSVKKKVNEWRIWHFVFEIEGDWEGRLVLSTSNQPYKLGAFTLSTHHHTKPPTINFASLSANLSHSNPPIQPYFIDVAAKIYGTDRVVLKCGNFACFAWVDEYNHHLLHIQNIPAIGNQPALTFEAIDYQGQSYQVYSCAIDIKKVISLQHKKLPILK